MFNNSSLDRIVAAHLVSPNFKRWAWLARGVEDFSRRKALGLAVSLAAMSIGAFCAAPGALATGRDAASSKARTMYANAMPKVQLMLVWLRLPQCCSTTGIARKNQIMPSEVQADTSARVSVSVILALLRYCKNRQPTTKARNVQQAHIYCAHISRCCVQVTDFAHPSA